MLTPNQIKAQSFPQVGRGAYRAQDVDAFMQRLYASYTELFNDNVNMKKKFSSLSSVVEEYNEGKNAIATALVKAQAVADQTLESANAKAEETLADANAQAQAILTETKERAEAYANEKKETADAYFQKAESELQRILNEAEAQSRDYVAEVNAKATAIIADANEKAATLVAAAYKDAQTAQQKADEIIARAQVEMQTTKNSIALFKQSMLASLGQLLPMVQAVNIDDEIADLINTVHSEDLPVVEAQSAEAPTFDLNSLFETFDMHVEKDRVALSEEIAPVIDAPAEETVGDDVVVFDDDVDVDAETQIAEEPEAVVALPDEPVEAPVIIEDAPAEEPKREGEMPVYHPFVAPQHDLFTTSLFDQAPAKEEDVEDLPLETIDSVIDEVPAFSEQDVTDEPQPLKFKLTKNFDIFDEDEE